MNQLERVLRKQSSVVRQNVINWLSAKQWQDDIPVADPRQVPIPFTLTGKPVEKAAE